MTTQRKSRQQVFVIMPFETANARNKSALTSFFENNLKKPIEGADLTYEYKVRRSGEALNITDEIYRDLYFADIVIADLSGEHPNPNVMFELGVRFAISRKPVILIREKYEKNRPIFDVSHLYTYEYNSYEYPSLEHHIIEKIRRIETGEERYESPVMRTLQGQLAVASEEAFRRLTPAQQQEVVLNGVRIAGDAIMRSFGPYGQGLGYTDATGIHRLAVRGEEILEALQLTNPLEQHAVQILQKAASPIRERYKDGSKLTVMLARELMEAGHQAIQQGRLHQEFINGMDHGVTAAIQQLREMSETPTKMQVLSATLSASRENTITEKAVQLLDQVGSDGIITLGQSPETQQELTIDDGFSWDRGYTSTEFVSPREGESYVLEDCLVLLCADKIEHAHALIPVLERVRKQNKPLLIVAMDITGDALATLVENNRKKVLQAVAVKAPSSRQQSLAFFEDCSVFTGASIVSATRGGRLERVELTDLGTASTVIVGLETTQVKGGGGASSVIEERAQIIRRQIKTADSNSRSLLRDRLARLVGKRAQVQIWGITAFDMQRKLDAWQSALSVINVARTGVSLGGGRGLLNTCNVVREIHPVTEGERDGLHAVVNALGAPLRALAQSAGLNPDEVVRSIESGKSLSLGVNVVRGAMEDLHESGIYDVTQTLCYALELARSVTQEFLQTSSWVVKGKDESYTSNLM